MSVASTVMGKNNIGITRSRTNKFLEYRKKYIEENSQFKIDPGSSLNDNGKNNDKMKPTELTSINIKYNQSSRYVDIFNSTNVLYDELRQNFTILQQEQQKRIIPKFDEEENKKIDKKINELIIEMTRKVRQADENINQLTKIKLNSNEEDVKENIKLNLATKLKEFSRDFKLNEEKYMKNYQELVGEKTSYEVEDLDGSSKKSKSSSKNDFLQLSMDSSHKVFRQRDEEISTLLSSITELASVFKDLQTLVHHQGTILDRIDYNIDNAHQNVKSAHKELIKTEKIMKNSCYRNSMMIIIILIFILSVLIVLKFTS